MARFSSRMAVLSALSFFGGMETAPFRRVNSHPVPPHPDGDRALPAGLEEFNLHAAQGKDCSVDWIEQAADCLPMMSGRTLRCCPPFSSWAA